MKILSITTLHDASCAIIDNGNLTHYEMEERISRVKHDAHCDQTIKNIYNLQNNFFDLIIFSNINYHNHYVRRIQEDFIKNKKIQYESIIFDNFNHHKYHAYGSYINSKFDQALCFVFDGAGSYIDVNYGLKELESIFIINKSKIEQILKHAYLYKQSNKDIEPYYKDNILISTELSVGNQFSEICESYGWHRLDGGKLMGLAQYKNNINSLPENYNDDLWQKRVDECFALQQRTQNKILKLIKKYSKEYNIYNIVLSGGYALNCVANNYIIENCPEIKFFVDPICFDAGISIGAGFYQYFLHTGLRPMPLENVYIGYLEKTYDLRNLNVYEGSVDTVVNLILSGNPVAIFHGNAEAGQRALGNRSILFDPRNIENKNKINLIKKRELFRPFAGSILEEYASEYFEMYNQLNSPYMMFAFKTKNNFASHIPAIVHVDNTCRIQTVNKNQNIIFYELINNFFKKTGIPMIGNTSFNLAGEPLVNTFDDAIKTLKNSSLEYLYLPDIDKIIEVKNNDN
jgi:carbamoyltransferase